MAAIEKENRRYKEIRERTEQELEMCRQKGVKLEDVSTIIYFKHIFFIYCTKHYLVPNLKVILLLGLGRFFANKIFCYYNI